MTAQGETPAHEVSLGKMGQATGYEAKDLKEAGRRKV